MLSLHWLLIYCVFSIVTGTLRYCDGLNVYVHPMLKSNLQCH